MRIDVKNLHIAYPDFRLEADFTFKSADTYGLMGPSGSGKSSLLLAMAGFITPRRGRIEFDGQSYDSRPLHKRPLSLLFQSHNLFDHLSLWQNAGLALSPWLRLTRTQKARLSASFRQLGLEGMEKRKPSQVSGGQAQRAALVRVLMQGKPALLLDEPFSALDRPLAHRLASDIRTLAEEKQWTLIVATHSGQELDWLGAKVLTLEAEGQGFRLMRSFGSPQL